MLGHHDMSMMGGRQQFQDTRQSMKQLAVVSIFMVGYGIHSALDAGILAPLTIVRGTFPPAGGRGGKGKGNNREFVHKTMIRDYAAVDGTILTVASDLGMIGPDGEALDPRDVVDGEKGGGGGGGTTTTKAICYTRYSSTMPTWCRGGRLASSAAPSYRRPIGRRTRIGRGHSRMRTNG